MVVLDLPPRHIIYLHGSLQGGLTSATGAVLLATHKYNKIHVVHDVPEWTLHLPHLE